MEKKNILVFPCGSEIGLSIQQQLKYSRFFHLIGGSSTEDHGIIVFEDYIGNIPMIDDPEFIQSIQTIVKDRNIHAIYPTLDKVMYALKKHEKEIGCTIVSSPLETTEICNDKAKTYEALKDTNLIPEVFAASEITEEIFPVFVKPKIGYGSRGAKLVFSKIQLNLEIDKNPDLLVLENLPGEEFTVDCFTDRHGNLLFSKGRKRGRIRNGISVNTYYVDNQSEFESIAKIINDRLEFRGAWFYQVKRDRHGKLKLLEVASRFGGSSILANGLGISFPLLSLMDLFNIDLSIVENQYQLELDRALDSKYKSNLHFTTIYIDYDDCLVLEDGTVNSDLIRLIFQWINKGKRVILLTKHIGDISQELYKHRLGNVFDKIIHLSPDEDKSDYINEFPSIFIDDSFAERKNISQKHHIPVFSPDMLNVLG